MKNFLIDLGKVSIFGSMPLAVNFFFIIAIITVWHMKKDNSLFFENLWDKRKNYNAEKIFSNAHIFTEGYCLMCITLIVIPIVVFFNLKYYSYINKLAKKVDIVGNSIFDFTAMTIGLLMVAIVFDKKYYLVFSMRDVLQKYKVVECIFVSLFSYIAVIIMQIAMINQNFEFWCFTIIELAIMYNIAFNTYICSVVLYMMFSGQKKELEMLGQLYRSFWIDKIDTSSFKDQNNWSKAAVEINVEYLLKKYVAICKKEKIYKIDYIEFGKTIGENKSRWYKEARNKLIRLNVICLLISGIVDIVVLNGRCVMLVSLNFVVTIAAIALTFGKNDCVHLAVLKLFSDTWGYFIHQGENSEIFIPSVGLRKRNVYDNYIAKMNSLNAFFYVWTNYVDIGYCNENFMKTVYQEVIDWIESIEEKNTGIYMPIYIIGFFLYQKDIYILRTREIYNKMNLNIEEFKKMFLSQIVYLTRNNTEYIQGAEKYLRWLGKYKNHRIV